MYLVKDLYEQHANSLNLELIAGELGLNRRIKIPEAQRPGLSLTGFLKNHSPKRILIFGKSEINFLKELPPQTILERLETIVNEHTPALVIAGHLRPLKQLLAICKKNHLPLFRTSLSTMHFFSRLTSLLNEEFAPITSCHGTFVDVFGVGMLIQGDAGIGKSEAALGLIERGHRLISDDIVKVKILTGTHLEGYGMDLTHQHMEIKGIGIINIAKLYGARCVSHRKSIDIVVRLEIWHDKHLNDRLGLEEKFTSIMNIKLPYFEVPISPGRNVVVLLETIALHYRAKVMGYHSAHAFNNKLLAWRTFKEMESHSEKIS